MSQHAGRKPKMGNLVNSLGVFDDLVKLGRRQPFSECHKPSLILRRIVAKAPGQTYQPRIIFNLNQSAATGELGRWSAKKCKTVQPALIARDVKFGTGISEVDAYYSLLGRAESH